MEESRLTIIIAIIAASPGIISIIWQLVRMFFITPKDKADITNQVTDAASKIMNSMQARIDELSEEVSSLRKEGEENSREILRLKHGIYILIMQIKRKGDEPEWTPDD